MHTERFAPSPTGELHLGHAFSALTGWHRARAADGKFLLRMEDLDQSRARSKFVDLIYEDLAWLGIDWDGEVVFQSTRQDAYRAALDRLMSMGLTFRCACTRRDIAEAIAAPQEGAVVAGPDGPIYPGTCRERVAPSDAPFAIRLDIAKAIGSLGGEALDFEETGCGPDGETGRIEIECDSLIQSAGDVVLARRDGAPAYHLAVVIDDAWQEVSHVTRGCDLFSATPIHRLLQRLLGLPAPVYHHHRLIRDDTGKRLAKRDHAHSLAVLRQGGIESVDIFRRVGLD